MFIRPELRKGEVDIRLKAPSFLVETLDLVAISLGITRQDVILLALDAYSQEIRHVSKVVAGRMETQRNRNGVETAEERK